MQNLFKSHYSIGKSILTLGPASEIKPDETISIFSIAKKHNLKEIALVEDAMGGMLKAYEMAKEEKISLRFGLRIPLSDGAESSSKYIIFAKNTKGLKLLSKFYSQYALKNEGKTKGRELLTLEGLKEFWDEDLLKLVIPFYDSFLYNNSYYFNNSMPFFEFTKPVMLIENNGLPIDEILMPIVKKYAKEMSFKTKQAQSIYYYSKKSFKSYMTFRCIKNQSNFKNICLSRPELPHFSSDTFCYLKP